VAETVAMLQLEVKTLRIGHMQPKRRRLSTPTGDVATYTWRCVGTRALLIAKVAMGRRLAVRLYWMWRNGCEYSPMLEFGSYAGQLGTGHGVK
jgi:hypothetical protein